MGQARDICARDAVAERQMYKNMNNLVELAERLTALISGTDWAVFAKNGTDMTTLAVSLARVKTGKRKIIMARGAYHGSANWCSSNDFPELSAKENNLYFRYNDIEELKQLFNFNRGEIAGIILMGVGLMGVKGSWDGTRNFEYQYSMSASDLSSWERVQQNLVDFSQAFAFMLVCFAAGVICLAIGWLM